MIYGFKTVTGCSNPVVPEPGESIPNEVYDAALAVAFLNDLDFMRERVIPCSRIDLKFF